MCARSSLILITPLLLVSFVQQSNCQALVRAVGTIRDLVALDTADGCTNVLVAGYYSPNDGGGGSFYWNESYSGNPNLGTVLSSNTRTNGRWLRIYSGPLDVKWFGAKGDGITDDRAAIQDAIDLKNYGTIYFPTPSVAYAIGDSLKLGDWIFDTKSNIVTVANQKVDLHLVGDMVSVPDDHDHCIRWIGSTQAGTNAISVTNSFGTYTLIVDAKPMIQVLGGRNNSFENLVLDGQDKAYSGIHYEFNQFNVYHRNLTIKATKICVRNGQIWNYEMGGFYYGNVAAPGFKTGANALGAGGWQGDTHTHINCRYYPNGIAGFSSESGQNLNQVLINCNFGGTNSIAGIVLNGGRLDLIGVSFTAPKVSVADIWLNVGGNHLNLTDVHSESGATNFIKTVNSSASQRITLKHVNTGHNIYVTAGGAFLAIDSSEIGKVVRNNGQAIFNLSIRNSTLTNVTLSNSIGTNVFVDISGVRVLGGGDLFAGPTPNAYYGVVQNVFPASAIGNHSYLYRVPDGNAIAIRDSNGSVNIGDSANVLRPEVLNIRGGAYFGKANPALVLDDQVQQANERMVEIVYGHKKFAIRALSDSGASSVDAIAINRGHGTDIENIEFLHSGIRHKRNSQPADYLIRINDFYIASTGTSVKTLPGAASVGGGTVFIIKSVGADITTTIATTGNDTIDGVTANDVLAGNASATYISDGVSNWEKN